MADSPSIEMGLRVIRRARIRAWFLAIGLLPVCILTSVLLPHAGSAYCRSMGDRSQAEQRLLMALPDLPSPAPRSSRSRHCKKAFRFARMCMS